MLQLNLKQLKRTILLSNCDLKSQDDFNYPLSLGLGDFFFLRGKYENVFYGIVDFLLERFFL